LHRAPLRLDSSIVRVTQGEVEIDDDSRRFDPGFAAELPLDEHHVVQISVFADNAETVTRSLVAEACVRCPRGRETSRGDVEAMIGRAVQLRALGAEGCDALLATGVTSAGVWR
jgi:hypothetical protein